MIKDLFKLLFIISLTLKGQPASVNDLEFRLSDTVKGAYKANQSRKHIFIASKFGSSEVEQSRALDSVSGFLISDIVLVYSKYKQSNDFNQAKLNRARWENLLAKYPSLFQSGTTAYGNICQAGIQNDSVARELTHGFYIYYENRSDPAEREKEIKAIFTMLEDMGIDTSSSTESTAGAEEVVTATTSSAGSPRLRKPMRTKDPRACRQPYYRNGLADLNAFFRAGIPLTNKQKKNPEKLSAEVTLRLDFNGQIKSAHVLSVSDEFIDQIRKALAGMELWNPAVLNGVTINTSVKFFLMCTDGGYVKLKGDLQVARQLQKCGKATDADLFDLSDKKHSDKLIPSVFEVNDEQLFKNVLDRNTDVDSMLLVVDLTGSMGPYIAQVLDMMAKMVEKNDNRVLSIALFNDGDGRPDRSKKIGKTGGIIILRGDITMEVLGSAVLRSMQKGNGGDVMENNIEAIIEGLKACKGCRNVMMVADNFATPRDGELLSQVDRPVHWALCGAYNGINTNYLDLIRANKGVLHTSTKDVADLHKVNEGEIITIENFRYQLKDGRFGMVTSR